MFIKISNGTKIQVYFYHGTDKKGRKYTKCTIRKDIGSSVTSEVVGIAVTSKEDRFVKEYGRKLSLKRALLNCTFNKMDRQLIWETYLNR